MKRILVTGGAGFLGSHLVRRLLSDGNNVVVVDNLSTGNMKNLASFQNNTNFEFMKRDVAIPLLVKVDEIYNLACPASPASYQADPIQTAKTNFLGALNILGLAKDMGAKVLQASTSEIYGDPLSHPQEESYWGNVNPIGIRSCYDEGKRIAETLFFDYKRVHKVHAKVVRIFNTYGPNMSPNDGRVVSNFIMQAIQNKDITIYGDGSQTRSFCYVDDLINGLVKMMDSDKEIIGPVNLGNPDESTILELAAKVIELTGSKSKILHKPLPSDDPQRRKPDIGYAKSTLNWQPNIELETGLKRTISYFCALENRGAS